MKKLIIIGIMAASILLTGCGKMGDAVVARTQKEVATSQVIGYASANSGKTTNILLTITEIWRGSEEGARLGITNGMQFSEDGYYSAGSLPEGAVCLFSVDTNRQTSSKHIIWVRSGRVENMTVQEFKAKIGL
jgi:hypothetical protein